MNNGSGEGEAGFECLNIIEILEIASIVVIQYPKDDDDLTVGDQKDPDKSTSVLVPFEKGFRGSSNLLSYWRPSVCSSLSSARRLGLE